MAGNPFNELLNCDNGSDLLIKRITLTAKAREVPLLIRSSCRLAQLFYDLAERMMLMGSMTKALEYA
ncbi:hypothetical protein Tco_1460223, partial [Tanacetum coccineum]